MGAVLRRLPPPPPPPPSPSFTDGGSAWGGTRGGERATGASPVSFPARKTQPRYKPSCSKKRRKHLRTSARRPCLTMWDSGAGGGGLVSVYCRFPPRRIHLTPSPRSLGPDEGWSRFIVSMPRSLVIHFVSGYCMSRPSWSKEQADLASGGDGRAEQAVRRDWGGVFRRSNPCMLSATQSQSTRKRANKRGPSWSKLGRVWKTENRDRACELSTKQQAERKPRRFTRCNPGPFRDDSWTEPFLQTVVRQGVHPLNLSI